MRVAIYARVSKNDGSQTPENQLLELREFAKRQGWEVHREYVDQATGTNGNRKEFEALFADAAKRKFDLVLFWALDRFTREGTLKTLEYLQRLTHCGVGWRSYQEAYLDSLGPFADVVISLMATLAKMENERRKERTKAGVARARREGKILGRPRVGVKQWQVDKLRTDGMSLRKIASELKIGLGTVQRLCAARVA